MSDSAGPPAITGTGLARRFGGQWAVQGVDLLAPAGKVTGFVGPNGAGKTTTLRMLLGLIRPTAGEARIGDHVVRGGPDSIPVRVRALVERPAFYDALTAFQNLHLLANLTAEVGEKDVDLVLARLGLSAARDRAVRGFSTGMLQRLGLALCLLGQPEVLVLDEPTSGLDPEFRVTVREIIEGLKREGRTTVLLSSHLLWELEEMVDHLVMIRDGRVVQQGALAELLAGSEGPRVRIRAEPIALARDVLGERVLAERDGAVVARASDAEVPELVAALVARGARVYEVARERASLEELYIATVPLERASPERASPERASPERASWRPQ